jgi:4-amino-4-deoxy-L-arabinose transferase-like glycosyltransferase
MLDSLAETQFRMNDTSASSEQISRAISLRNVSWAILILVTLYVCYFSHLGTLGLVGPDEPRYAWIARDMAESGDWVTPRLYGRPWFEKPALYYWGAALSFKLFGVSEVTARLPSAFCALLATLALAWLALRLVTWELARWVLLLLPTTVGMIGFSHSAGPDMPFAAMLTMAMVCADVALGLVSTKIPRYLSLLFWGFFLGAAVLAKGPAAVILAGGAMLLWAAFTKRWRDSLILFHPIAIGAFLVTALPWYVLCARRNSDFLREFIIEHNFNRYLTPEFRHIQPFWYYLPVMVAALLPWAVWLCWFSFRDARVAANHAERARYVFMAAWGFFPVLFFSLSKSKLPGYILPAVPALVFLIALAARRTLRSQQAYPRYATGSAGIFYLMVACWALFSKTGSGGSLVFVFVLTAGLGGLAIIFLALIRKTSAGLVCAVMVMLLLITLGYVGIEKLDPGLSARASAEEIGAARAARTYSFKLQRGWGYQLDFYLHREITEWSPDVSGEAIVVTTDKNLGELKKSAEIIAVIADRTRQAQIVEVRVLAGNVAGGGKSQ